MRALGAALLIAAGAGTGLAIVRALADRIRMLSDLIEIVNCLRTAVCVRHTPLPEALSLLAERFPSCFGGADELGARLPDVSFSELWTACVRRLELPPEEERTLIRLGTELSAAEPPERSFARCEEELIALRSALFNKRNRDSRVILMAALSGACLIVIVLL